MAERLIKRTVDIVGSLLAIAISFPIMLLVFLMVKLTSKGPAIFWSNRFGQYGAYFNMPKFRTMVIGTPDVATHELRQADRYVTPR